MKSIHKKLIFLTSLLLSTTLQANDLSGKIGLEGRYFLDDPAYTGQKSGGLSLSLQPEYKHKWNNDHNVLSFIPFYRKDSKDPERTHGDIRQLDLTMAKGDWEFQGGISKVFWGVTESQHLVDIINQTDGVEGVDGEDKLGQPMFRMSRIHDNGTLNVYILPYFRERTFVGANGRFRGSLPVDTHDVSYESSKKDKHIDYAARLNHTFDKLDVGLSYFDGTSRTPQLTPNLASGVLKQHYPLVRQAGLDLQYTGEAWLWKLETIHRDTKAENHSAAVGGFEYSLPSLGSTGADLGLLAEYHRDSRGYALNAPLQNDLFLGARLGLNDTEGTEFLAGTFIDLDDQSKVFRVEGSRRIGKGVKLNIEAQKLIDIDNNNPLRNVEKDSFVQIELQKYF
ncbi:MAG: hypothetical protein KAH22_04145 [Thiotrichaceae bacterium]|nr:hypothetical protein [Thiotrichaceae bacterium]